MRDSKYLELEKKNRNIFFFFCYVYGLLFFSYVTFIYTFILFIPGKDDINRKDVSIFLESHPNLQFLGLFYSDICLSDRFVNTKYSEYNPRLVVTGTACESQILESLRRYASRSFYVQKSLYNLFRLTVTIGTTPRVDILKVRRGKKKTKF